MDETVARGYRHALRILAVQLLLSVGLVSDTLGIFVLLAMPLVAVAWLPAGLMIWRGNRLSDPPRPAAAAVGAACMLVGTASLVLLARWALLGLATR